MTRSFLGTGLGWPWKKLVPAPRAEDSLRSLPCPRRKARLLLGLSAFVIHSSVYAGQLLSRHEVSPKCQGSESACGGFQLHRDGGIRVSPSVLAVTLFICSSLWPCGGGGQIVFLCPCGGRGWGLQLSLAEARLTGEDAFIQCARTWEDSVMGKRKEVVRTWGLRTIVTQGDTFLEK